jgi:hypothetical protein
MLLLSGASRLSPQKDFKLSCMFAVHLSGGSPQPALDTSKQRCHAVGVVRPAVGLVLPLLPCSVPLGT